MEEQKNNISTLVELVLYKRICLIDEDPTAREKERKQMKKESINTFIKECSERSKIMTEEQIKEHVIDKLNGMIKSKEQSER